MGFETINRPSEHQNEVDFGKEHLGDEVEVRLKPMLEGYFEGVRGISFQPTEKNSREDIEGVDGFFVIGENGACRVAVDFTCKTGGKLDVKKTVVQERNQNSQELTPLASQIILIDLPPWFQEEVLSFPAGGSDDPKDREKVARITMELFLKKLGYIDPDAFTQAARILKRIYAV